MDDFEKRLKRDAEAIHAEVSPELKARIDASLHGIEPIQQARREPPSVNLWWASSLTGLAAAVVVIVLINWNQPGPDVAPVETVAELPTEGDFPTEPDSLADPGLLQFRTADFASPLEQELLKLQSDIEKARESVQDDLDFTF